MDVPNELSIKMLNFASSLADYYRIKSKFSIPDSAIERAIIDECTKNLEGYTPIEQLYAMRQKKYILLRAYGGPSTEVDHFQMVGTKPEIIEKLISEDIEQAGVDYEPINEKEAREYYDRVFDEIKTKPQQHQEPRTYLDFILDVPWIESARFNIEQI